MFSNVACQISNAGQNPILHAHPGITVHPEQTVTETRVKDPGGCRRLSTGRFTQLSTSGVDIRVCTPHHNPKSLLCQARKDARMVSIVLQIEAELQLEGFGEVCDKSENGVPRSVDIELHFPQARLNFDSSEAVFHRLPEFDFSECHQCPAMHNSY